MMNRELAQTIVVLRSEDYTNYDIPYRSAQLSGLHRFGREAVPFLLEVLSDEPEWCRVDALASLTVLRAPEAIPRAMEILCARDDISHAAAAYLGALQVRAALPVLIEIAAVSGDPSPDLLRTEAITALGAAGFSAAVPVLVSLLEAEPALRTTNMCATGRSAVRALGLLRAHAAIPLLQQIARQPDAETDIRVDAVNALSAIGAPSEAALACADDAPSALRVAAAKGWLATRPAAAAADLLRAVAAAPATRPHRRFAIMLGEVPSAVLAPLLPAAGWLRLLSERDPVFRSLAVGALGELGATTGLREVLYQQLMDPYKRDEARALLDTIEPEAVPVDIAGLLRADEAGVRLAGLRMLGFWLTGEDAQDRRVEQGLRSWDAAAARAALAAAIEDPAASVRRGAIWLLRADTGAGATMLAPALAHDDALVRVRAALALVERGDPRGAAALGVLITAPEEEARGEARAALADSDLPAAGELLIAMLRDDPAPYQRHMAARALGMRGAPAAVPALAAALHDPHGTVRHRSLSALIQIGVPSLRIHVLLPQTPSKTDPAAAVRVRLGDACGAIDAQLKAIIADSAEDYGLRREACRFLPFLGQPGVIAYLESLQEDSDTTLVEIAVLGLGEIGSLPAQQALVRALSSAQYATYTAAQQILSAIGDPEIEADVIAVFEQARFISHIAPVLGAIGSARAVPVLMRRLHEDGDYQTLAVAEALGALDAHAALPELATLLLRLDGGSQARVLAAIGQISADAAIPLLMRGLDNDNDHVQQEAMTALLRRRQHTPQLWDALADWMAETPATDNYSAWADVTEHLSALGGPYPPQACAIHAAMVRCEAHTSGAAPSWAVDDQRRLRAALAVAIPAWAS